MAKNYMAEVAKMLGVEIGEEFTIPNKAVILKISAKDGLMYKFKDEGEWQSGASDLQDLLMGEIEIVKLPWKPKEGEYFYFPTIIDKFVLVEPWRANTRNCALQALGMCYRTREEAETNLAEDYKKLTGKELEKNERTEIICL